MILLWNLFWEWERCYPSHTIEMKILPPNVFNRTCCVKLLYTILYNKRDGVAETHCINFIRLYQKLFLLYTIRFSTYISIQFLYSVSLVYQWEGKRRLSDKQFLAVTVSYVPLCYIKDETFSSVSVRSNAFTFIFRGGSIWKGNATPNNGTA